MPTSFLGAMKTSALHAIVGVLALPLAHGMATLTGNITLGSSDSWILSLNPGGTTRTVTLPAADRGRIAIVRNTGTVAANLTINNPAGSLLASLPIGAIAVLVVNDGAWVLLWSSTIQAPAGVADPGNAGAIAVTGSGYVPIVTIGAETRTLAVPTFPGQQLDIYMKTDGGDCVITSAQAINVGGNTTITLNDAGDHIRLVAVEIGSNLRWRVIINNGTTLG